MNVLFCSSLVCMRSRIIGGGVRYQVIKNRIRVFCIFVRVNVFIGIQNYFKYICIYS
jgi:hypothetical protein